MAIDDLGGAPRSKRGTARPGAARSDERSGGSKKRGPPRAPSSTESDVITAAIEALHAGDFSARLRPRDGVAREVADAYNDLAERLEQTASELGRVTRVVGRDGEMGERLPIVALRGGWAAVGDSFNTLIGDLVRPSTEAARVLLAVAEGDLSQKMALEIDGKPVRGEFLRIGMTVNRMVDQLRGFASEVTRVGREVGTEGKLGGQAKVPGAAGTWRDLVDNVNQLADNLTNQIRAMAEVATAITEGDLTRSITVEAQGEVLQLKERVNQMIVALRETTQKNQEQDWLKTNLAKFSGMMQGHKSLESVSRMIMSELTPLVQASHGAFFVLDDVDGAHGLRLLATYAYRERKHVATRFRLGEGLVGQAALERKSILLTRVPLDYIAISSGLGEAAPLSVIVLPVLFEDEVRAVIELASFEPFSAIHRVFLDQLSESIGVVLNMIGANMRTEELLSQSQSLAEVLQEQSRELQQQQDQLKRSNQELEQQAQTLRASEEMLREQQEELQQVNDELEEKASLLVEQNQAVEQKNREVEMARLAVEEKAAQLALSSKYKSEFLANMSHELRTPLNSLLILARMLADNKEENLSGKQTEYARTIHAAGTELLGLIDEVLDLSKVEAGKIDVYPEAVEVRSVLDYLAQTFRPVAAQKRLELVFDVHPDAPRALRTDGQRLKQVLRNLLANAIKFTERGSVRVRVAAPRRGESFTSRVLAAASGGVVGFSVIDTGIGIPRDKQQLIFEAFQQADGTTSRKYGGTGLGLSISRELARLLGGEVKVESELGRGSSFTIFLPVGRGEASAESQGEGGASRIVVVSDAERELRADTRLFLQPVARGRGTPSPARRAEPVSATFDQQKVLIVDDDVRNIYALATVLEEAGLQVVFAENGRDGIDVLRKTPDVGIVLLDVMMPEMDGYETMRRIRAMPEHAALPLLALTAKAMKGDREKCLSAGASDYITKPVDPEELLSRMRIWLSSKPHAVENVNAVR